MGLIDKLRRVRMRRNDPGEPFQHMEIRHTENSVRFSTDPELWRELEQGQAPRSIQEQYLVLEMLGEQGSAVREPYAFVVPAEDAVRLDDDERMVLRLPPRYEGAFFAGVTANTTSRRFAIDVTAQVGGYNMPIEVQGPTMRVGGEEYLLGPASLTALTAIRQHALLDDAEKDETTNVRLVATVLAARRGAEALGSAADEPLVPMTLGHLDSFDTQVPTTVGLELERREDGSVTVAPRLDGAIEREGLASRWHQVDDAVGGGVVRNGNQIILLEDRQLEAVREVRRRPVIPAEEVADFVRAPGDFFDPGLVDVELTFSVRVTGIGVVEQTFAEVVESGIDWFDGGSGGSVAGPDALALQGTTHQDVDNLEERIAAARASGNDVVVIDDQAFDIRDDAAVEEALAAARARIDLPEERSDGGARRTVSVAMRIAEEYGPGADGPIPAEDEVAPATEVDLSGLRRTPYPHQREGIEWMAGLMDASLRSPSNDPSRVQGAILADDMGLGKTFMALVAMRHCARADAARNGTARPHLAVLPVALIDNWETELAEAFDVSPFTEVVVLQGDRDLRRFRTGHRGRETLVREDQVDEFGEVSTKDIRLSLMVGEAFGEDRVDMPGRLVLTTYDTLRSNQLSLGQVDWGVVAFDEAQNLKNPDSLGARAAKGLKAGFKLLATGTPVENSLRDFWSLMDTAQPGHLGSWQDFKAEWVDRIAGAEPEEREAAGVELRDHVGRFMLRRVKEDHLTDLPTKTVHTPFGEPGPGIQVDPGLAVTMPTGQAAAYDKSLASFQGRRTKAGALDVLGQIRAVSLHPEARGSSPIDTDPRGIEDSARISATVRILDQVRDAGEKAIVFVGTKRVQRAMSGWLRDRYGIPVPVVNGDTKATGSGDSRRAIIQRFEAREGFNVIIMAPRAVGVGLTIVGANHAIHLEREWNPAKEAQATDRIYRIGQKRPVHVYLPMAEHPRVESFDRNLDRLLRNKTALKDTILVPEAVDEDALASSLGLVDPTP